MNLAGLHNEVVEDESLHYCDAFVAAELNERDEQSAARRRWGHPTALFKSCLLPMN